MIRSMDKIIPHKNSGIVNNPPNIGDCVYVNTVIQNFDTKMKEFQNVTKYSIIQHKICLYEFGLVF